VDAAADGVAPTGATLASELIARAAAIGAGRPRAASAAFLPRDLRAALRACEVRARRLADGLGQGAALDFLGDAIVAIAVDHSFEPGEARAAVTAAAEELDMSPEAAAFVVFRRALPSKELAQLPPAVAAELTPALLVELAPAAARSLWFLDAAGSTTCLVSDGKAPRSRRLREVARAALDGVIAGSAQVHVRVVERWDRPYAALVARARGAESDHLDDYLAEAAAALAPLLERAELALHCVRDGAGNGRRRADGVRDLAQALVEGAEAGVDVVEAPTHALPEVVGNDRRDLGRCGAQLLGQRDDLLQRPVVQIEAET